MTDAQYQDNDAIILDLGDQTIISDAVLPKFSESLALKGLAEAPRLIDQSKALMQEFPDALSNGLF